MLPSVVVLIAAAANADIRGARSIWAHSLLVKLGQASFALYLVHFSMARLLERLLGGPLESGPVLGGVLIIAFLGAATGASLLAYRLIEHPMERILRGKGRANTPPANRDTVSETV